MGIFKLMNRYFLIITILVLVISFKIYSQELSKDEFYGLTLKEALDYSDNGNPIDIFLDFKRQNGGKVDTSYGDYVGLNGDAYYYELDEKVYEEESKISENLEKGEDKIKDEVKNEKVKSRNELIREYLKKNTLKIIAIFLCIVMIVIGIFVFKYKIVIIVASILLIVLIACLNIPRLYSDIIKSKDGLDYLTSENELIALKKPIIEKNKADNESEQSVSEKQNSSFEYISEEEFIKKMCDKKYDIASIINDYILKIYYCVKQKAQNKPLDYNEIFEVVDYNEINKDREYVSKEELLDRSTFLENDPYDYGINMKTLSFDEMEHIYNNIPNVEIEFFNDGKFINELSINLESQLRYTTPQRYNNKNVMLSRYLTKKMNRNAICKDFFDDEILKILKDWYIENDQEIELPFGVVLKFEKQKFVKKDVKEIIGTNSSDENLIVYYKDSDGNIHGDFILDDYMDENNNFNKTEILYNIKRAILTMDVNGFKPYYNYEDIDVYDENGEYIVSIDKKEAIDDNNMSRGTNRDLTLLHMLLLKKLNMGKFDDINNYSFTQNFINKYKVQDNIYEIIPYNIAKTEVIKINKKIAKTDKLIRKLILEDGTEKICIFKVIWTNNYEVDDVLTYIVPEDKMNLTYEEMYQLAFNE